MALCRTRRTGVWFAKRAERQSMRAFQRAAGGAPDGLQSRPPDVDCGRILRGRTSCDRSTSFLGHGLGHEPSPDLRDDRGDRVGLPSPPPRPLTSSSSGSRTAGTRGASYSLRTRGPRGPEDHVPVSELAGIGPRISLPIGLHNLWNTEYMTRVGPPATPASPRRRRALVDLARLPAAKRPGGLVAGHRHRRRAPARAELRRLPVRSASGVRRRSGARRPFARPASLAYPVPSRSEELFLHR